MKYIDSEKLKAEIKKIKGRKGYLPIDQMEITEAYMARGVQFTCDDVLNIIDSLQQEQPNNEDIDKVAQELYEHLYELKRRNNVPTNLYDKQEIIDLWKAGVEYGRNHPKQEQPEVDLDAEIDKFLYGTKFKRDYDGVHVPGVCMRDWKGKKYTNRDVTPDDMRRYARHFAEWGAIHLNARKEKFANE